MFICITVDLILHEFAKYLQKNIERKDTFLNDLDTRFNNSSQGDVHPCNRKKKSLIRHLCLMLLFLSCTAFISNNVPTTVNSEGYMQTSNKHRNSLLKNLDLQS